MKLLEVRDLTFGYEDAPVLDGFTMTVFENEILLIEGENGAGKTTLLKCITNVLNNGKRIYIQGTEVFNDKTALKNISFIMSEDTLYDYLTVTENIVFFKTLFDEGNEYINKVKELCVTFGIAPYENYVIKNLSQGTRNKLYLAIMLSKKHSILILDEPFTALDKNTQDMVMDKITMDAREKGKCVVMVTHIHAFKNIATRNITVNKIHI